MNALALFPWDDAPAPITEPTDADLDARAAAYVAQPWTPTPDDARQLAAAVRDGIVADLADHRARKSHARQAALAWLREYAFLACDLGWCAVALGLSPSALRADIRARVAEREAEKAAHAEDMRRRRERVRRLLADESSFAGHVMFAALVTRVMGGEWEAG